MEVVSAITVKLVEYAVLPIGRQLGYLFCYSSNVSNLTRKAKELQEAKESLEHSVDAARNNGEEIESSVLSWLREVNEISGKVEKFQGDAGQARTGCTNLWSRRQLSRRAKKMGEAIVKIQEDKKFGNNISYRQLPKFTEAVPTIPGHEDYKSRISVLEEILESLRDPTVNMIGVCGLGGVGKTTLVKQVGKKAQEDKLFNVVALAAVTQKPEVDKIQTEIADMLGQKFEVEGELLRAIRLRKRLKQEKNILIILDDLWTRLDLDKVGIPSADEHKGCKILLTARNRDVLCNQMNVKKPLLLEVLLQEEALKLFKDTAELHDTNENSNLQSIVAEVAKMCDGLPLALVTVARALTQKYISEWRDALRQQKSPHTGETTEMQESLHSCMRLSYDRLESPELKSTFLLCASLSYYIFESDLLKYCVGLGLFKGIFTIQEAREKLETWLCKLKSLSLLQAGETSDEFTMHDIVRASAISIAIKEKHALTVRYGKLSQWPDKDQLEQCSAITLVESDICCEFPQVLDCPSLNFLHIYSKDLSLRIPDNFFRGMCKLRVMDLTQMHFPSLPSSIALLGYLQTLCLAICMLDDVALIGELKNLKILSFLQSDIKQLPRELGKLTQLQLLDLTDCSKLEIIPPNVFSSLKRLEELNMENSFVGWENEVSNSQGINARVSELDCLHQLTSLNIWIRDSSVLPWELLIKLKKYRILIGDVWNWSGEYITSRTLKLKLNISFHLAPRIKKLLERVEDLHLDELNGVPNILYQLNGEGFPSLKHLLIQNNDEIEHIVNSKDPQLFHYGDVFPILESLIIHNLINLEQICIGPHSATSFAKLEVIKVEGCHKLKNLFAFSMVRSLKRLREIEIIACNFLEEIVILERAENCNDDIDSSNLKFNHLHFLTLQDLPKLDRFYFDDKTFSVAEKSDTLVPFFCEKDLFPTLETLVISNMDNLKVVWCIDPVAPNSFGKLKSLEIKSCEKLLTVVPSNMLRRLQNLETLEVDNCGSLNEIFRLDGDAETGEKVDTPLKKLSLNTLSNLKHIWNRDPQENFNFRMLKVVEVLQCQKLKNIFPASVAKCLQLLEQLDIRYCAMLEEIVAKGETIVEATARFVFPQLSSVILGGLWVLQSFSTGPGVQTIECPKLKIFDVMDCPRLGLLGIGSSRK
ncbi:Disease resistance protein [Quillaja saponaria]|uniref:Disease resistance protein n=1 Tax=Quillaja saponaria TaxID=32244 RepID=A0AAD7KPP3_QUISA|nr:Disease resistance protein [Quillaja saponaria]